MRKKQLLDILCSFVLLSGCTPEYFECQIEEVDSYDLPQTVSVIDVPYSFFFVQTKFQPGHVIQDFRYRATIDGEQYSFAENPGPPGFQGTYEPQTFQVVVPENDSHLVRLVRIETSVKDLFGKQKWGEWNTVYDGRQEAVPDNQPLPLDGIESKTVRLVVNDRINIDLDIKNDPSGIALKALLLRGDLYFKMYVANNGMDMWGGDATEAIRLGVPLNHVTYHSVKRGDIYMSDGGGLSFEYENRKRGINGRETYLGKVSDSGIDAFVEVCDNCRNYNDKEMHLTLVSE